MINELGAFAEPLKGSGLPNAVKANRGLATNFRLARNAMP
jgi:hypothetical protein